MKNTVAFPARGRELIFIEVILASIGRKNTSSADRFTSASRSIPLPFAIEEFGDQCWVYGSDIPHGDRLYGAVDVFLKRNDISEAGMRKLLVDNTARFYGIAR